MHRSDGPPTTRLIARWTFLLIGLSVAWRLTRFALAFPIWGDEAFVAVSLLTRDFRGMLEPLAHFQIVPVGFMWAELAAARLLGYGPEALRVVPVLAGIASLLVFWRLAPRLLDRRSAFIAVAIFAASYYPMRHANEIKPYSFDLLAALLITAAAWSAWRRPDAWSRWVLLALVTAVAAWCSYPSVFVSGGVLAALGFAVLRRRSVGVTAAWLASGFALVASFALMYVLVARGQEQAGASLYAAESNWRDTFPPVDAPWRLPAWFIATHTGNLLAYPVGGRDGRSVLTFVLVVAGVVTLWRRRGPVAALLLGPFALTLVAALLERYPYGGSARVAQHLAPMICLFAGAGLVAIARRIGGAAAVAATVGVTPWVMAAVIVIGVVRDVRKPYKGVDDENCRVALAWLSATRGPGDHRVVAGGFDETAPGPDLRAWGGRAARVRYALLLDRPGALSWSPPAETLPRGEVVWLVVYHNAAAADADATRRGEYVEAVRRRLGIPRITRFEIDPAWDEWIEFHRFGPLDGQANPDREPGRSRS